MDIMDILDFKLSKSEVEELLPIISRRVEIQQAYTRSQEEYQKRLDAITVGRLGTWT